MAITPLARKQVESYSDFYKDLTTSPVNNDLARRIDEESIKESIRNLVLTDRGERLFQPDVGCDVRKMLFENIGPDTAINAKTMIENVIKAYEPRCDLIGVDVLQAADSNSMTIVITFGTINKETPTTFAITLTKVR